MNIPNLPLDALVDPKTGLMTDSYRIFFEQLITELQSNVSNEGYILPEQPTANFPQLTDLKRAMIYDSDTDSFMVNINGVFKTVTVT